MGTQESEFHSLAEVNAAECTTKVNVAECKSRPDKIDSELRSSVISFAATFNEFLRTLIREGRLREDYPILDENEWLSTVSNQAKRKEGNFTKWMKGKFMNQILEETKESNSKKVPLSTSTPIKKWTDAHLATVETDKFEVLHGEMEEHLEGDYGFAIEEHHLFGESSKLHSSSISVQDELEHSMLSNERELEFKNQLLELETVKMDEQLNMEENSIVEMPFIEDDGILKNLDEPLVEDTKEVGIGDGENEILGHPMFLTEGITLNPGYQEVKTDCSFKVFSPSRSAEDECSSYVGVTGSVLGIVENWAPNANQVTVETDYSNEGNDGMIYTHNLQVNVSLETKLIKPNGIFYLGVAKFQDETKHYFDDDETDRSQSIYKIMNKFKTTEKPKHARYYLYYVYHSSFYFRGSHFYY
ncbi:uncharacterized protein [Coffea arabica]|uniref:Uncharacterized protein n=1 Tax=Coffea arabica TaxID=13443 RepID=A0ABM4UBV8_COFAR